jgi:uncharacterized protein YndB with AHSA1/START domain
MMKSAVKVRLSRPVEEVFAFIANPANDLQWNAELSDVQLPDEALAPGVTYDMIFESPNGPVTMTQEVTAYEENQRFAFSTHSGDFPIHGEYALSPTETGTLLNYTIAYDIQEELPERVIKTLKQEVNRRLERNFSTLKSILS